MAHQLDPSGNNDTETPLTHKLKVTDNLAELLDVLPPVTRQSLIREPNLENLLEIVLDLGREPEARFPDRHVRLSDDEVTLKDIEYITSRIVPFGKDNRAGIPRTLHRISAIRNRSGVVIGLTCRVGRAVFGTIDIIQDVVEKGKSILCLGRPGVGKTTKLREIARVLADEFDKRVIIVDTSNEIAGDGDIPHPAIGRARRMHVAVPELQHAVMIEAVENHMPEVIVIDEIGTEQEAFAARTIAERGVQLIGTAHGNSLENLLMNPTLSDLVGGVQTVTLGDDEARRRGTQKTVLERKAPPTFEVVIELMEKDKLAIHHDVAATVDRMLLGDAARPEIRVRTDQGDIDIVQRGDASGMEETGPTVRELHNHPRTPKELPPTVKLYGYGVSRTRLERALRELYVPGFLVRNLSEADVVVALRGTAQKDANRLREAQQKGVPIYLVKSNTYAQIANAVRDVFSMRPASSLDAAPEDPTVSALQEAQEAIDEVLAKMQPIELRPQNSYVRRLQHQLIERHNLVSESLGEDPFRRIRVLPS